MASSSKPFPDRGSKLTLGFGLVSVPVALKPLANTQRPVPGKGMCPEHGPVLNTQAVCSRGTDHEHLLDSEEKLIGYPHPHEPKRYVFVDPDVVKSLKEPRSGAAKIEAMVPVDEIDPGYLSKAYMVWPQSGAEEQFALLAAVLREKGVAAACTTILSQQTQSVLFRWSEHFGCVLAHVVEFDQRIRHVDVKLVKEATAELPEPSEQMIDLAEQLFQGLEAEFSPADAQDTITPRLQQAILAADAGTVFTIDVEEATPVEAGDLMAQLQASLKAAQPEPVKKPRKPAAKKAKAAA